MSPPIRAPWWPALLLATALLLGGIVAPDGVRAQTFDSPKTEEPIFRRFSAAPTRQESRLRIFELPAGLRPQTDPLAEPIENVGLGYEIGFRPFDRAFVSLGINWGRMAWEPTDPDVARAEAKQMDVSQSLNFWLGKTVIVSLGLGLGIVDGLVVREDGRFEHTVVPYIPLRVGLGAILGDAVWVGLRVVSTPFFADAHSVGQSRLMLGLGWVY